MPKTNVTGMQKLGISAQITHFQKIVRTFLMSNVPIYFLINIQISHKTFIEIVRVDVIHS